MTETYKDGNFTITVYIPDRTPEQQAIRDKEIEQGIIEIYK
jgi:negative regulator of sigma E activity